MRNSIIITAVCLLMSVPFALPGSKPAFDPRAVVSHLQQIGRRHCPTVPGSQPTSSHRGRPRGTVPAPASSLDDGEFLIDTSITYVGAPGLQDNPAIAFDGTDYLVVWEDGRSSNYSDIYGARVTPAGTVLDSLGIPISTATNDQCDPAVAFDGTNYLVVWTDRRSGGSDIYGARVTPAGTVLEPNGIPISTAANGQWFPALSFDGTNFLVVWEDRRSDYNIYGARVTPAGTVLEPNGIPISTAASSQGEPAVSFDGANFLVVWHDYRNSPDTSDIYAARVTPAGTVLDSLGIPISTATNYQYSPAVSFDGTNFLVVWEDCRSGGYNIYGARVTPAGTVLEPNGIPISTAANDQGEPAVSFDGANFLVVWHDYRSSPDTSDIYAARVTPAGTVLEPNGIPISTAASSQGEPAVSFDGTNFLVVWQDERSDRDDIYGARVSPGGVVLDPSGIAISTVANGQWYPAVSFDGTNFLVVWTDERSGPYEYDIYGARVTPAGTVLEPNGIPISTAANGQGSPALSFDGANFLVVWTDYRSGDYNIYGARVSPGGVVLDPSGIAISTVANWQQYPAVSFDGTNFLVVWEDSRSGYNIYGARVTPAGTVLEPNGIPISTAANDQRYPAVSFDGANFLVVWHDYRSSPDTSADIYAARVTPAGTVLDSLGIPISTATNYQYSPAVSFDGTNFLVVWTDERSGPYEYDIYGARVTPAGTVLEPNGIPISTAANDQWYPAVSFDGANFLVVWPDYRSGSEYDIYGARVSRAGVVFDSGPVVRQAGNQWYPALARGPGSQMFLVYEGWAGTVGGKTYNTQRIWGKMNPSPAIEEKHEPIANRHEPIATVVRGVLFQPASPFSLHSSLFDPSGRKVLDLHPGANDVSGLAPGVYFVRRTSDAGRQTSIITKVILSR